MGHYWNTDNLEAYINTHYTAPRMVFAGAGAVTHDQLVPDQIYICIIDLERYANTTKLVD